MIPWGHESAGRTEVFSVRKQFANGRAAQTCLTRAARIDGHELATGTLSLVRQHGKESRPSRVVNGLGQHSARESL
jgi:hypothetical protein